MIRTQHPSNDHPLVAFLIWVRSCYCRVSDAFLGSLVRLRAGLVQSDTFVVSRAVVVYWGKMRMQAGGDAATLNLSKSWAARILLALTLVGAGLALPRCGCCLTEK